MTAYYNENDPKAAAWLRQLIADNLIAPGEVDERSIEDVRPTDLAGYTQCHFFAGIGGWSYALRLAGWPDDQPVWTGSCPCQPFSSAGARRGVDDPRHLWPIWRWLLDQCRPAIVFGEQVASKAGRAWLAGVSTDLEAMGYGVGAADLCAAGVGAPHIRQRLWWVADTGRVRQQQHAEQHGQPQVHAADRSTPGAHADGRGDDRGLGDPEREGLERRGGGVRDESQNASSSSGEVASAWACSLSNWLPCADGKARRLEPGIEPLVARLPGRVGLSRSAVLRGYGNSIVPQLAAEFIAAYLESCQDHKREARSRAGGKKI